MITADDVREAIKKGRSIPPEIALEMVDLIDIHARQARVDLAMLKIATTSLESIADPAFSLEMVDLIDIHARQARVDLAMLKIATTSLESIADPAFSPQYCREEAKGALKRMKALVS